MFSYGFDTSRYNINEVVDLVMEFQNWIDSKYSSKELINMVPIQVILLMSSHSTDILLEEEVIWSSNYDYDEELSINLLKNNFIDYCKKHVRFIEDLSEEYSKFLKEE